MGERHARGSDGEPISGVPRWVKVFAVIGLVLVLVVVVALLSGHGPSRHMGGHAAAASRAAGTIGW